MQTGYISRFFVVSISIFPKEHIETVIKKTALTAISKIFQEVLESGNGRTFDFELISTVTHFRNQHQYKGQVNTLVTVKNPGLQEYCKIKDENKLEFIVNDIYLFGEWTLIKRGDAYLRIS